LCDHDDEQSVEGCKNIQVQIQREENGKWKLENLENLTNELVSQIVHFKHMYV
jgi:hypothetical protein